MLRPQALTLWSSLFLVIEEKAQMMKLKYLFDNRSLAEMILKYWDYDRTRLDLFDYFRISANAVYPFELDNRRYYLRFSPVEERSIEAILAEIEFLSYLRSKGYPAVETRWSRSGREIELVDTPWGSYLAVVFPAVPGQPLNQTELTERIIYGYGKALGQLHKLSQDYLPAQHQRVSWKEQMDWMAAFLDKDNGETAAKTELRTLRRFLEGLTASRVNYGLVHYDFEYDNVFYEASSDCYHPIDFDDAVYHWFVLDIDQSLDSLSDILPADRFAETQNEFIRGYRSILPLEDSMLAIRPVFRRYANLYGYVRILRSIRDQWPNEPEWMVDLRSKLSLAMEKRSQDFGKPLTGLINL
jgi:Ser/Thr protein kinase RdoA (MazF antagonist)